MVPVAANSGGIVYYHYIIKLSRLVQKCHVRVPKRGGMSVRREEGVICIISDFEDGILGKLMFI